MSVVRDYLVREGLIGRGHYRSPKLLQHARGMPCMHCARNDGSTVMAHANAEIYGKGAGVKAHDVFVAALCSRCHGWLDQGAKPLGEFEATRADKLEMWRRAHAETLLYLLQTGLIRVA